MVLSPYVVGGIDRRLAALQLAQNELKVITDIHAQALDPRERQAASQTMVRPTVETVTAAVTSNFRSVSSREAEAKDE